MSEHQTPVSLALFWHMHQPSYRDPVTGEIALPWVRLHSTRAYYDMAWLLDRHPEIKATFNFVPVLIEQLSAYVDRGERDRYWHLTRKPARLLTAAEKAVLVRHFFSVHADTGIRPRARYWNLFNRRGPDGRERTPGDFEENDYRDLQVLFNLAWFGYAARNEYPLVSELDRKGRDFTEDEKHKLLDLQLAVMRRLLPLYRKLVARGQIEVTATPYYHPILPLIIDTETMARCQPDAARPSPPFQWPSDAEVHVTRALTAHEAAFGVTPKGMWPAEGSVSPEALALLSKSGVEWFATDESQLYRTTGGDQRTDLYRPYAIQVGDHRIGAVFRDRGLSDLMSFTYARNPAQVSIDDFLGRVRGIGAAQQGQDEVPLVVVALDGENPWEYYADSGRPFLEGLYRALEQDQTIRTVRVSDHLAAHPPKRTLHHIHSGSWINADFGIWIGGQIENSAWRLLAETRAFFERRRQDADALVARAAYEHLLQAEGSDWFWWYGEPFHSENDEEFDHLFRAHLRQVYALLSADPPPALDRSLYPARERSTAKPPRGFVSPRFDGRESTYFDWAGAGLFDLVGPCSSMYQAAHYFGRLKYGFDMEHLYLRMEPVPDQPAARFEGLKLRVRIYGRDHQYAEIPLDNPQGAELWRFGPDMQPADPRPLPKVNFKHGVIELGVAFKTLDLAAGEPVRLTLHLLRDRVELDRFPATEEVRFNVPDESFESANWSA